MCHRRLLGEAIAAGHEVEVEHIEKFCRFMVPQNMICGTFGLTISEGDRFFYSKDMWGMLNGWIVSRDRLRRFQEHATLLALR